MGEHRRSIRQTGFMHRRCSIGLLSFAQLEMRDHDVRIVDTNSCGVEIESDMQMEPGLVWFHSGIEDHQGGILLWSREQGERHRAAIRFLSLSAEDERHLRYWPPCPGQLRPCSDLEDALSLWMRAARREDHRSGPAIS